MSARRFIVEADGGSRGNPGPAAYGAVVRDAASGAVLLERAGHIGKASNNVAEYRGLIAGLEAVRELDPAASVEARLDSKLVVEQMSGRWKIKHPSMAELAGRAARVLPGGSVTYTWVPRARNAHADRLANEALDAAARGETWNPGASTAELDASVPAAASARGAEPDGAPQSQRQPSAVPPPASAWLAWIQHVQSIAQAGLTYAQSPFDLDRYAALRSTAALMAQALTVGEPEQLRLLVEGEAGYLTPKLDVRAAVHDPQGRVLMVREAADGLWTLPGGWADVGESPGEGAVREVFEESGYVVRVERLLGLYERERWGHPPLPSFTLKLVVGCELVGGSATPSIETTAVGWYGRNEVPPLSVGRCSPELLARVFEHYDDPTMPADLD